MVELAEDPDGVSVAPSLTSVLARLAARLSGRFTLVGGRLIAQLDDLFGPGLLSFTTVRNQGAEIRPIGSKEWNVERPQALVEEETVFRKAFDETEGIVIEVKSLGVAVQLDHALLINPYSPDDIADAIDCPHHDDEHLRRWRPMCENVCTQYVVWWSKRFTDALASP